MVGEYQRHSMFGGLLPTEIYGYSKPFKKSRSYEVMIPWPEGWSSATARDKDLHRDLRRNISSGFSNANLIKFEPAVIRNLDIYFRKVITDVEVEDGWTAPRDMHSWSKCQSYPQTPCLTATPDHWLALDTMVELGFGIELGLMLKPEKRYILDLLHMHAKKLGIYEGWPALNDIGIGAAVRRLLASWVPVMRRFNKWHHAFTEEAVSRSSKSPAGIFAPLIRGSGKPGTSSFFQRPHEQMVAEGSFVTLTGGDGYALTMSTLLFFLARHPECQERLAHEILSKFPRDDNKWIHWGPDLQNCQYLRACIDEAMRMVPPASNIPWRECEIDNAYIGLSDEPRAQDRAGTNGFRIPRGTDVGVSPYTMFRRADIFRDPGKFWPERWLEPDDGGVILDKDERRRARMACKPFSIGPRNCSGQQVAMMMTFIGMANLLSRFEFKVAAGKESALVRIQNGWEELDFELHFFTMWKEGPWIQFKQRNQ